MAMEQQYKITEYQHEDVEEMIALGAKMHREGSYRDLPYEPDKLRQLDQDIRAAGRTMGNGWVSRFDGKIIGMYVAYITYYFFCDRKIASDYFFYVDPEYRNRFPMMSVKLIKRAEMWAKAQGANEFSPATSVMIEPRVGRLYEYMKFDVIGSLYKKKI